MQLFKDHLSSKTSISIKVNGKMIKEMEEVFNSGKMGLSIKGTGRIILHMDTEDSFTLMATSTLEVG